MTENKATVNEMAAETFELGEVQSRFADLLWENSPLATGELVKLCAREFGWKKSTTYTVLHKLCERGLFINENGVVRPLIPRAEFYSAKSVRFVRETFGGSLPSFLAAFAANGELSQSEVEELQKLIDNYKKGN